MKDQFSVPLVPEWVEPELPMYAVRDKETHKVIGRLYYTRKGAERVAAGNDYVYITKEKGEDK